MNSKAISPAIADDQEAIEKLIKRALNALLSDEIDEYFGYFSPDAVWMIPSSFRDIPIAEARSFYGFTERFRFEQASNINEVMVSGDMAFARISLDGYLRPKADVNAAPLRSISRRMWILERGAQGDWTITRDIWNNPTTTKE